MLQTLTYKANVAPEGVPPVIRLSQNENGRVLVFDLVGTGTVNIPAGSVVTISGTKPDGVVYSAEGTLDGTSATFDEDTQMTAVSGEWPAKLRVTYDGETIASVKIWFAIDADPVRPGSVPSESELNGLVAEAQQYAESARSAAYGSPLTASTAADMTNTDKVYVYTGSESGYLYGHWYYYNGTAWTDGGVYQSQGVQTDTTLTQAGVPADAKETGDRIGAAEEDVADLKDAFDGVKEDLTDLDGDVTILTTRVAAIEEAEGLHRYGVTGIGQSASALTRIWDSVGMTAQVGTDGNNANVVNNFDDVTPFNRRKCVGKWHLENGRPVFRVHAYLGDEDYAEDGSMGDYVAVECPRAYYYLKNGTLGVSAHQYPGWRPFDIFCRDHNPEDTIPFVYLPAYALAKKDGHAVSLPGLANEQGYYQKLVSDARTYDGDGVQAKAIIEPIAVNFYDWALFTVEFAQQNCQNVMYGCAALRNSNDDRLTFMDATHAITNSYQAGRVAGQSVAIVASNVDVNDYTKQPTHTIVSIIRCDENGNASASGTHQLLELNDLGRAYYEYDTSTEYKLCGRPWLTGSCNDVSTPSGSPTSNTNGYYPMKYRHRENVYGNQCHTTMDLFNKREGTSDDDRYLDWYYLPKPEDYTPSSSGKPDATDLATSAFVKLDVNTPHANYRDGYIKTKQYSEEFPDVWIPGETTGGSYTTYYADYAYLVNSNSVRSVRLGGNWSYGVLVGFSYVYGNIAPSIGNADYGGDLCFPQ